MSDTIRDEMLASIADELVIIGKALERSADQTERILDLWEQRTALDNEAMEIMRRRDRYDTAVYEKAQTDLEGSRLVHSALVGKSLADILYEMGKPTPQPPAEHEASGG